LNLKKNLGSGIRSRRSDTAVIVSVSCHVDISRHTPASSPAVLDDPVVTIGLSSITNSQHTVIEAGRGASWLIVDTAGVHLEGSVGGIDGNRDGTAADGSEKGGFRSGGDVGEGGDGGSDVGGGELASVRSGGGVRVGCFGVNSVVGDNVLEGLVHQTSIASLVTLSSRTINQVLLR